VIIAALGGLAMVAWDLALDPLMAAQGHWIWETPGAYFGRTDTELFGLVADRLCNPDALP